MSDVYPKTRMLLILETPHRRCMISQKSSFSCSNCSCGMSAVPQAAFAAIKVRQNHNKPGGERDFNIFSPMELTPLQYNSKLMNSIWGMYNRYSVHNLKRIMDDTFDPNQQLRAVGCVVPPANVGEVIANSTYALGGSI